MAEAVANTGAAEGGRSAERTVADRSLRHVEEDVLITKMVRKKAHEVCFEPYVRGQYCAASHYACARYSVCWMQSLRIVYEAGLCRWCGSVGVRTE